MKKDINRWLTKIKVNIHSFRLFLERLFKSTTTQRRSRHSMDTVSELTRRSATATVSEGLAQGPYVAAGAGFESVTIRTKGTKSTNEPSHSIRGHPFMTSTKNQVFDPPSPLSTWGGPPLWTSTHGRHEIHTALLKRLVQ